jgi:hypothetical protein
MSAYATLAEANAYFDNRLYSSLWAASSSGDRDKALEQAARIIDRLNFAGEKNAASVVRLALTGRSDFEISLSQEQYDAIVAAGLTQALQFPRGSDTVVPDDIKIASYEIAFALLDGVDPDKEFEDLGVVSQGYSSVRTTYDRSTVPEHTNAGIPSPTAWRFLKPYVRAGGVKISRV